MNIPRLMSMVINRPLMVAPNNAKVIYSVLAGKAGISAFDDETRDQKPKASRMMGEISKNGMYSVMSGVAILSVVGELVNRGAYVGADSGLVSYEGIDAQLRAAAEDNQIKAILLDVESPGGEAVGAMELASTVRKVSAQKPVYGFVNGMAASAAYAMVSGAKKIYTSESGISGSIGVVLLHMDYSEQVAAMGVKPTLIHAGAHKVDGNPFEPLSDSVKSDLQAEVMQFYGLFVDTVAAGRKMSKKAIRETEARTFIGQSAVEAGLVDAVATFEDVLSEINRASGRSTVSKGVSMTDNSGGPGASTPGITQEQVNAAAASAAAATTTRMTAVLTHADIAGSAQRMAAASKLLATSTMAADQIVSFVTESVAASTAPTLEQRAASANDLRVGAGSQETKPAAKSWTDILKSKGMHVTQMGA